MYVWIWRHLPGNTAVRATLSLVLFAAVAALLLFVVFPAVEPHLPFNRVTISSG
ncbi:hypothetical protein [Geodermatophilus sabuli]|uniref:hypothetical protein n=1 Tax=Geodermatophilus sabuli TaxID=1564158 RepID=UPI001954C2AF|nr:hypothetical protein [Geodermatophilus sabuli]